MQKAKSRILVILLVASMGLGAGVRKEIETSYLQKYKNKAMFLKVPVRGLRQVVFVKDDGINLDRSNTADPLSFKVGDQVRITDLSFKDDQVRFKIASVDFSRTSELVFQFVSQLREEFTQQTSFDSALNATFMEGLHYAEIDSAKEAFIKDQYDQLIQQFASTTGTSTDFVIKAISEKNPEYLAAKKEAAESRGRLQEVAQDLAQEIKARKALEAQLQQLRSELSQSKSAVESLREDRQRLSSQRESQQQQIAQLQKKNQEYERQINGLVKSLDVKTASNADLGKRVEALSTSIDSLKNERLTLSQKLEHVGKEVERLRKANEQLSIDLKQAQTENGKMAADIRALTSNKNSLEAQYLQIRKQKEILERAAALEKALHFERRLEEREAGAFQVADLFLLTKKIGTLEVQVPNHPGRTYPVRFKADSPEIIQFTEQERKLHRLLGKEVQIETAWTSSSNAVKATLLGKEALQHVGPRENAQWSWLLDGEILQPERVLLHARLINTDGQKISLESQEFVLSPSGFVAGLREYLSPIPLMFGAALGMAAFALFFGFRGRSHARHSDDYVAPKKL